MNLIIIFLIIIVLGPLITNFIDKETFQSHLDLKYYHNDEDCIFNGTCQLPPNNINFYTEICPTKEFIVSKIPLFEPVANELDWTLKEVINKNNGNYYR